MTQCSILLFVCGCQKLTVFMRSSTSHPVSPHDRLAKKTVNGANIAVGGRY